MYCNRGESKRDVTANYARLNRLYYCGGGCVVIYVMGVVWLTKRVYEGFLRNCNGLVRWFSINYQVLKVLVQKKKQILCSCL